MRRVPHVPQRTCVACRQVGSKLGLLRIVRTLHGEVRLDETGKVAGRGAYVCHRESCLEQAVAQKKLSRALGVAIDERVVSELRQRFADAVRPGEGEVGRA